MVAEETKGKSLLSRRATRRAVIGTSLAAASVAAAYAAVGDKLGVLGGGGSPASISVASDTDAIKKESVRINHLLRRAGFGVSHEEYDRYQSMGLHAVIDELVHFTSVNDDEAVTAASAVPVDQERNRGNLPTWWLVRMATTRRPLQEKMTFFWHGLLTSQLSVVRDTDAMLAQNDFYRQNALGSFPDILRGITFDTAMMVYLDMNNSQKRAPNENYARELMELFSLGIGNYTEQDIREAARAFTGWQVPRVPSAPNVITYEQPAFRPDRFDSGTKTFLGKNGNFRAEDIVNIIAEQPAHARFIVGRLFEFFLYPEPADRVLQPFLDAYWKSGRNVGAVVEALFRSDVMYSAQAYRAIVKSPVEYAVGAVKALGLGANMAQVLAQGRGVAVTNMGQTLFEPPNVAGWPGGPTWLNSATMFARLNFLNQLTAGQAAGPGARGLGASGATNLGSSRQALDYFLPLAMDDNVPDEARQVLAEYGGGLDATLTPEQLRGLVYLILASPQFHLS